MSLMSGNCGCTADQVDLMFKKAEQFIDEEIADRTMQLARYWVDLYPVKVFPDGAGITLDKVRFFGDVGPQWDGFEGWRLLQISRNAADGALGEHDGCGYKFEEVGHGLETVSYQLMQRDLHTKPICIKDIRTFYQYVEVQNLIFQNLTNISANQREQLNRNAAMSFATKYIALPNLPFNTQDPHQLPVIPPGVEVGKLTYRLMLQLYHALVQEAAMFSLGQINGNPAFGVVGHPETLHDMTYEDPEIRKDMRECSGTQCELIEKYNFLDSIGPFILMPDLYAPRYNRDASGNLIRVFPFDRNVPIEIGTRPITNPDYHTAEFEMILFLTRDLFSLRSRRALSSVGGETNFDAETAMFEWKWHNPPRCEDPYRRTGRYVTTAEMGVEPGDFTDIPALLVRRKPAYAGLEYWDAEVCPPVPSVCNNDLPPQQCPCPQVIAVCGAVSPDELVITFDRDTGAVATDVVQIDTVNGSFIEGTVVEANVPATILRIDFGGPVAGTTLADLVQLRCLAVDHCNSGVSKTELCNIIGGEVTLLLCRLIRADAAETITLNMGDGSQIDVPIVSIDQGSLAYTVTLTYQQFCDAKGVCSVCVPTATEATCPDCDPSAFVDCVPPGP